LKTANAYYKGNEDLLVLWIDPSRLKGTLKWEQVGDSTFPHLYGPLNISAVVDVIELPPGPDGVFDTLPMPKKIANPR
jgi:uncharacterized protein (DUF952 family)